MEVAKQVPSSCCMKEEKERWAAGRAIQELGCLFDLMAQAQIQGENWEPDDGSYLLKLMGQAKYVEVKMGL